MLIVSLIFTLDITARIGFGSLLLRCVPLQWKFVWLCFEIAMFLCFHSSIFYVPILITLITEEGVSEELLMEVENELTEIDEDLGVIIQIEGVTRFG